MPETDNVVPFPEPLPTDDEFKRGLIVMAQQVQWLCLQIDTLMKAASRIPLIRNELQKASK